LPTRQIERQERRRIRSKIGNFDRSSVFLALLLFMLTDGNYKQAAEELGCEVAAILAVISVESAGDGFLPDGRPKILFEAHIFHRYTKGRFDTTHPHLSSPTWNRKLYKGGAGEYDRLEEAISLDRRAAIMSASWGAFQIMGFNLAGCGFTNVEDFVAAMRASERRQLEAFIEFIKSQHLDDELRQRDWATFARIYNGPSYKANRYDEKPAKAYAKFKEEHDERDT